MPNFVFSGLGTLNIPVNFLASIVLHLSSIVLLLQYFLCRRRSQNPTPYTDSIPWKTALVQVDPPEKRRWWQWRKKSLAKGDKDTLPSLSPLSPLSVSLPLPDTPASPKSSLAPTEGSDLKTRRLSRTVPKPWSRQTEIPSAVYLPRLTILTDNRPKSDIGEGGTVVTKSPLSLLKHSLRSPRTVRASKRSGMTLVPDPLYPSPLRVTRLLPDGNTANLPATAYPPSAGRRSEASRIFMRTPTPERERSSEDTLRGMKRPVRKSMILAHRNTRYEGPSEMKPFRPAPVPKVSSLGGGEGRSSTRYYL
jgi:hypothetical protein